MMDKVWLAIEGCDGQEQVVGVYRQSEDAVAQLKVLIKAHEKYLDEKELAASKKWFSSVDGNKIFCDFISTSGSFCYYAAVEHDVL